MVYVFAFLFVLGFFTAAINGDFFRDMMRDTDHIQAGAEVFSVDPVKKGIGKGSHFEAEIRFKDGSRYRTSIGNTEFGRSLLRGKYVKISYDEPDIRYAINKAIEAHEDFASDVAANGQRNQFIVELTQGIPWASIVKGAVFSLIYLCVMGAILYGCQAITRRT